MKTTSETYKTLFESGAVQEYRITVGGVAYDSETIYDKTEITKNLFDKQTFTIGAFTIDTLKVKLNIPSEDIERRANVEFEYRYVGDTPSEWISFFKGKVSKRTKYTDDVTTIEAHTVAANYDTAIDVLIVSEYPANARTVTTQLATHLGLEVDNIEDIIDLNIVEYPNEMTVVEVLQEIAKNSGGNWIIVGDKLRLVVASIGNTEHIDIDDFVASGVTVTKAPFEALNQEYRRNYIKDSDDTLNEITWNDIEFDKWSEWV